MEKYQKTSVADQPRVELHDVLGLTGAEVSVNRMPAGASVPFVHSHKQNEEIYGVLSGRGTMTLDGEQVALAEGDWLRVSPEVRRQISAAADRRHQLRLHTGQGRVARADDRRRRRDGLNAESPPLFWQCEGIVVYLLLGLIQIALDRIVRYFSFVPMLFILFRFPAANMFPACLDVARHACGKT